MIPHVRGMFWVTIQIILLLTWFVLLVLGQPFIVSDMARFVLEGAGMLLTATGIVLTVWGMHDLGSHLTPYPEPKKDNILATSGIYGKVRHPIYGGLILVVIGVTMIFLTALGLLILPAILVFFYLKSNHEEQRLLHKHPAYGSYTASTKRFIPFVW